jgi:hypothetical protein
MALNNHCIDCGNPTSGLRCKSCNGKTVAMAWAVQKAAEDVALLSEVAAGMTAQRLAVRHNTTRQWQDRRIKKAQRRQALINLAKPT